jgi:hypothetical protein
MKILVDMNLPKTIAKRLKELDFEVIYLSEVLPPDTKDEDIVKWMKKNNALILTGDKRFPLTEGGRKIILAKAKKEKVEREAILDLIEMRQFPKGAEESAELSAFATFLNDSEDPFFNSVLRLRKEHKKEHKKDQSKKKTQS